jgi:hypothetical protein
MISKASSLAAAALAIGLGMGIAGTPAVAAMSHDQIKAEVEKTYSVSVLRVKETEVGGKPALAVTVMNKGGNDNRAFQVNTLIVDPNTGHLVSVYGSRPDGYRFSEILESDPNKQPSDLLSRQGEHPFR